MADFPGMTIATPRIPIFPSIPIPSLYGTSSKLVPGKSSDELMESVLRDYENSTYRTDTIYHREPATRPQTAHASTPSPPAQSPPPFTSTTPTPDKASEPEQTKQIRVLAATTIPSFVNLPKVPIPEQSRLTSSTGSSTTRSTSDVVPSPFATTLSGMTHRVYASALATPLNDTTSGDTVGPPTERSLSIHTPKFKGVTPEQLMSSYIQDLAMPSQIVDCAQFICWLDFVSTWSFEERQKRADKISVWHRS